MSERGYRWDSEDYARHSSAQAEWALELIGKLGLRGHEEVLDIGSGDGKVTVTLAGRVPRGSVLGIDSSPEATLRITTRVTPPPAASSSAGKPAAVRRSRWPSALACCR